MVAPDACWFPVDQILRSEGYELVNFIVKFCRLVLACQEIELVKGIFQFKKIRIVKILLSGKYGN